jgi:ferredoxin-type protein NapH
MYSGLPYWRSPQLGRLGKVQSGDKRRRVVMKFGQVRVVTASLAILVVVSGVIGELNYSGICTLGVGQILATCPLGFLERALAARELLPQWPYALLAVVLVILLGRVFCGWLCPGGLLRRLLGGDKGSVRAREAAPKAAATTTEAGKGVWRSYSSYSFLGGALIASFLFRFPVFCLFCPVGVFFGLLAALSRAVSPGSLGLELIIFPVMLGIELWMLKKHWCRSICPIGALLSIIGSLNRFLVPVFHKEKCLTSKGLKCGACERACPEGIELETIGRVLAPNSCTKCLACYEKCPKGAIEIAVVR